jgi:hypothetical protein
VDSTEGAPAVALRVNLAGRAENLWLAICPVSGHARAVLEITKDTKNKLMPATLEKKVATILVVDDDPAVLGVVVKILENSSFSVLSSTSGARALKLAEGTHLRIDLLLSDVDMPEMSGPDLGENLKRARPELHVMLMSGGSNGNLLVLNYGWAYIQKPFVPVKLVQMITDVLQSPDRSQLGGQEFDSRKDAR